MSLTDSLSSPSAHHTARPDEAPSSEQITQAVTRVEQMEFYKDKLEEALPDLERLQKRLSCIAKPFARLEGWYQHDWMQDYRLDEQGVFGTLRRGVLSEDTLYNLLGEYKDLFVQIEQILASIHPQSDALENQAPDPIETEDPIL